MSEGGKKFQFIVAVAILTALAVPANAQFWDPLRTKTTATANEIVRSPIGRHVTLKGSLKKNVRRAQYIFADATGSIRVRIEREVWRGREISRNDRIEIRGKVENDVRGRFIDVYAFKVID